MCFSHLNTSLANRLDGVDIVYFRCIFALVLYTYLLYLRPYGGLVAIVKAS